MKLPLQQEREAELVAKRVEAVADDGEVGVDPAAAQAEAAGEARMIFAEGIADSYGDAIVPEKFERRDGG